MRTPDGRECPYYYADVQRWRVGPDECRLLAGTPDADRWTATLCATCPVPEVRHANACPNLTLQAHLGRRGWRFWERRVLVSATCTRTGGLVTDLYRGCGHCHEPLSFVVAEAQPPDPTKTE